MCVRACVSACVCVWSRVTVLRAALHTRTEQSSSWPAVPLAASSMSSLLFSPSLSVHPPCLTLSSVHFSNPFLKSFSPFFIIICASTQSHNVPVLPWLFQFITTSPLFTFFSPCRCTSLLFSHLFPTVFIQSILSTPPLHNYKSSLDKTLVFLFSWTSQHNRSTTSRFYSPLCVFVIPSLFPTFPSPTDTPALNSTPPHFHPLVHLLLCIKYASAFEMSAGEQQRVEADKEISPFVREGTRGFGCCPHYWGEKSELVHRSFILIICTQARRCLYIWVHSPSPSTVHQCTWLFLINMRSNVSGWSSTVPV